MRDPFSEKDRAAWYSIAQDFSASLVGLLIVGATVAYMVSPIVRFFDPYTLELVALLAALGGVFLFLVVRLDRRRLAVLFTFAIILAALVMSGNVMDEATTAASVNDARCAAIQHDMFARTDRRQDDAAMMQALGCRPLGNEMPVLPR